MFKKTEDFLKLNIKEQLNILQKIQSKYKRISKKLLFIIKNYSNQINTNNSTKKYYLDITNFFKDVYDNLNELNKSQGLLNKLVVILKKESDNNISKVTDDLIKKYDIDTIYTSINETTDKILSFLQQNNNLIETEISDLSDPFIIPEWCKENTLIISEKDNKVILPYTFDEIKKYIDENSDLDLNIETVINLNYTKPLNIYNNSFKSRFMEGYNLIRYRENGSILNAIDLGLELMFKTNLHPAIISACKNINQLDIYLACLDYNELNDFKYFKVIFEIPPMIAVTI